MRAIHCCLLLVAGFVSMTGCLAALEDDLVFLCDSTYECPSGQSCQEDEDGLQGVCRPLWWCDDPGDCETSQGCDESANRCRMGWCDDDNDCTTNWNDASGCDTEFHECVR